MTGIIIAFLAGATAATSALLAKKYLATKKRPDLIADTVNNANMIHDQLDKMLIEFEANRIWIAQFHNGGHYYSSGVSIKKFSIFYEVVSAGIAIIQQQFQNVL